MIILIILFQRDRAINLHKKRGLFLRFFHVTSFVVLRSVLFRYSRLQMFFKIGVSSKFSQKTSVLESHFNNFAGIQVFSC